MRFATIGSVLLAVCLLAAAPAFARQDGGPRAGGVYRVGQKLPGQCKFTDHVEIATRYQRWFQGAWSNAEFLPTQSKLVCDQVLTAPGLWRMRIFDPDGDKTIKIVGPFIVTDEPCSGDDTKIVKVTTPNGGTSGLEGLQGMHVVPNETLTTEADVNIDFADGSRVTIAKGSSYQFDGCQQYNAPDAPPMMKLSLFLGKIWAKLGSRTQQVEMNVGNVVCGNRGTTFSIAYDRDTKLTTVQVEEGSVWVRPRAGGKTIIVNAGQTATQRGNEAPVVQGALIGK